MKGKYKDKQEETTKEHTQETKRGRPTINNPSDNKKKSIELYKIVRVGNVNVFE